MFKRKQFNKIFRAALLPVVLLLAASVFNKANNWQFSPFFNILDYTISHNTAAPNTGTALAPQPSVASGLLTTLKNAASRVPTLFKHGELPENQNIYFWCEKIPELNILPAPGAVIPLAAAAIMVLLVSGAWKKRYGLLLLPVIMLVLPLCARDPIGRYRLMLLPYFFVIISCAVVIFLRMKQPKQRGIALLGAGIGAFFSICNGDVPQKIRPFDYSAYGMAMENSGKCADPEEFLNEYLSYWQSVPENEEAFCLLMDKLLKYQKADHAIYITGLPEAGGINPDLLHFYRALCCAQKGLPAETEMHLRKIKKVTSLPPHAYKNAFMLRNWAANALKNSNQ